MSNIHPSTVVALSGGLDSSTLLFDLREKGHPVRGLVFDYGQRHRREIQSAHAVAAAAGVPCETVLISELARVISGGALLDSTIPVPHGHYSDESMKSTIVPNRNMIFLAIAAGHALSIGASAVAFAAHSGDHAIYPDCRPEFIDAMKVAVGLADHQPISLLAPFMHLTKTDIVRLGASLGVPFGLTWSCYEGREFHCGRCGTCVERREAFGNSGVQDETIYASKN